MASIVRMSLELLKKTRLPFTICNQIVNYIAFDLIDAKLRRNCNNLEILRILCVIKLDHCPSNLLPFRFTIDHLTETVEFNSLLNKLPPVICSCCGKTMVWDSIDKSDGFCCTDLNCGEITGLIKLRF